MIADFAVIPEWVIDTVTPRALQLYAVVSLTPGQVVTRRDLAAAMRCHPQTVNRAVRELRDVGALLVEAVYAPGIEGGGRIGNRYYPRNTPHLPATMSANGGGVGGE